MVNKLENFLLSLLDKLPFPHLIRKTYFIVKRYVIFIIGGFISWLILISITAFIVNNFQAQPFVGYTFGLMGAIVFAFNYHRYITFKKKTNWQSRFTKFAPLELSLSGFNWLLFYVVTELFGFSSGLNYVVASFFITWGISVVNFSLNRLWIFRY